MKYIYSLLFLLVHYSASSQRVYVSKEASSYDALIYQETNEDVEVSWNIYKTENTNPNIWGNWKYVSSKDSARYIFKLTDNKQAASFSYRFVDDSMSTRFSIADNYVDVFSEIITYSFVDNLEDANIAICITPNKWLANEIIYITDEPLFTKSAYWVMADKVENSTIKVFVTTNRVMADKLIYFTDNPLEAQIR